MLNRRLQILLDERRYRRLLAESRRRKVSVAAIIREAIDGASHRTSPERAAAARQVLSAPRMEVPDAVGLRRELDAVRGRE